MLKIKIGLELRILNSLIRRYLDFSSHKNGIDMIAGNNGWVIGYLGENADACKYVCQKDIEDHFYVNRSTVSNALSLMDRKSLIGSKSVWYIGV